MSNLYDNIGMSIDETKMLLHALGDRADIKPAIEPRVADATILELAYRTLYFSKSFEDQARKIVWS